MVETALVYIYRTRPARGFVGCGAVVAGGFIATCRHVWRDATAGFDADATEQPVVDIEYPHCWRDGAAAKTSATLADSCPAGPEGPEPELVLLEPKEIPAKALQLAPASAERFETGAAYARAGKIGLNPARPLEVRDVNVQGEIPPGEPSSDGRRQFTGSNAKGYWSNSGSSGSPVFRDGGEQLAGIVSLSETGRKGDETEHEAFVVPGTLIGRYLSALQDVRKRAREQQVPAPDVQPIIDVIRASGVPLAEVAQRFSEFINGARRRGAEPVPPTNHGSDIDATIGAARDKLSALDAAGAMALLREKIEEEEAGRRRRLLPLLRDQAEIERLAFDHAGTEQTLSRIVELDPDDAWSWLGLGDIARFTASLPRALHAYEQARAAADRTRDERDLSVSQNRIGDVKRAQGDLAGALDAYAAGMAISERLAARDPANSDWQRDLSVSQDRIGDVKRAQGDLAGALDAYAAGMAIRERLAARDPANSDWQRDLSVSHNKIGDVKMAQGDLAGALDAYTAGMAIRERLAARDPANSDWQRDLSVSHNKIGDVKMAQGDLAGALDAYAAGLAIRERLAARDPVNSDWQRDLSVSQDRIGDVKMAQGDLAGALDAYAAGLAIRERLAARDPANSDWQRDLSVSHNKIGDVKMAQGDLAGALDAYAAGMAIRERLAARDPANSDWQRDLSVSHNKIGDVKMAQGDLAGALDAYAAGMAIRERLAARDPVNSDWQRDLSVSQDRIGDVKMAQGDLAGALDAYAAGLAIRERLAARDPANSDWQRDVIVSCVKIADAAPGEARAMLVRALAVAQGLAASGRLAPADECIPAELERRLATLVRAQ